MLSDFSLFWELQFLFSFRANSAQLLQRPTRTNRVITRIVLIWDAYEPEFYDIGYGAEAD